MREDEAMTDPNEEIRRLGDTASGAAKAISGLLRAAAAGDAADIAAHPDLAYLDLQTRGFYD